MWTNWLLSLLFEKNKAILNGAPLSKFLFANQLSALKNRLRAKYDQFLSSVLPTDENKKIYNKNAEIFGYIGKDFEVEIRKKYQQWVSTGATQSKSNVSNNDEASKTGVKQKELRANDNSLKNSTVSTALIDSSLQNSTNTSLNPRSTDESVKQYKSIEFNTKKISDPTSSPGEYQRTHAKLEKKVIPTSEFISKRVQRAEQTFRYDIIDWVNKLKTPKVQNRFFSIKNIKEKFSQSMSALKGAEYIDERDEAINKAENKALGDSGSYYGLVASLCGDGIPINAGVELLKNLDIFVEEQLGNFGTALLSSRTAMEKIFINEVFDYVRGTYSSALEGFGTKYISEEYKKTSPSLYKKMTQFFFSRIMKMNLTEQNKFERLDDYIYKITNFLSKNSEDCERCDRSYGNENESTKKFRAENSQRVFFAAVSLLIEPFFDRPDFMDILIKIGSEKRILDTFKKIYKTNCISIEYLNDLLKGFETNIIEKINNKSKHFTELYQFLIDSRKSYTESIRARSPEFFLGVSYVKPGIY
ncbi:hypothetical protein HE1_01017 [Holospora elegans E1]|uniref:Uncharacterized protein n=1 Tax=Holospora elegans E1 TaxID=1427503 RepID=A0A023DYT6_9PROT|nr:hypothetical protein [Holospora elegans]GAJ46679.1 hypothetical protein HE1_01017 [Holospora elegans E1]